jgi:hypothetical protein
MENTGFILDILSALTKTQNSCCEVGRDIEKDTVYLGDCKSTMNWMSFQGNVNLQISFVRLRQRGESHFLAK